MANHKKRKTANQRAGCKMCKPWKINGNSRNYGCYPKSPTDMRKLQDSVEELWDEYDDYAYEYYVNPCYQDCCFDNNLLEFLKEYNVK